VLGVFGLFWRIALVWNKTRRRSDQWTPVQSQYHNDTVTEYGTGR
jgi:hypothetical protein